MITDHSKYLLDHISHKSKNRAQCRHNSYNRTYHYCKGWYAEVKCIEKDLDHYLKRLQENLIEHRYHTSEYEIFTKKESNKEREIYKLPFYPDRICQWAILQVIEPYLLNSMTKDTSLPPRV